VSSTEAGSSTVVPIDHAAVKIIEIGGREASSFERHEGRRSGGITANQKDHPFRPHLRLQEALEELDSLGESSSDFASTWSRSSRVANLDLFSARLGQGITHRLGAHLCDKRIIAVRFAGLAELVFAQQLVMLQRRRAGSMTR
jgi:hypothetical protein